MRIRDEVVWMGEVESSSFREVLYMHPAGDGTIDIEVVDPDSKSAMRGEFGYVVSFDGRGHVFLVDYQGIHYAPILPKSIWDRTVNILEMIFRPMTVKIACAGPDWL